MVHHLFKVLKLLLQKRNEFLRKLGVMVDQILELWRIRIHLGDRVAHMDIRGVIVGMPTTLNVGEVGEIPDAEIDRFLPERSAIQLLTKLLRVFLEKVEAVVVDGNGGQVAHVGLVLDEFELVKEHVKAGELAPPSFRNMRPVAFPRSDAVRAHIVVLECSHRSFSSLASRVRICLSIPLISSMSV